MGGAWAECSLRVRVSESRPWVYSVFIGVHFQGSGRFLTPLGREAVRMSENCFPVSRGEDAPQRSAFILL